MGRFDRTQLKTTRARRLRVDATEVERKLWSRLRNGQIDGCAFRRQHPTGPFILDFYCSAVKLAIELDGGQHVDRHGYDVARTRFLEERGIRVLRFWNSDVNENFDGVLEAIWLEIQSRRPALTPTRTLPLSGGGNLTHES